MRNLYEQCLKLTQFAAMEFEEIFQFSQERLKQALETELIENGYAVRKQRGFLRRLCCQSGEKPGQPKLSGQSRENAYLRAMLWRADTSYIRLRMAETSLRLMVLSAWNVPFASEPVRMPAR